MGQEGKGAAREEGQRQELPGINDTGWGADAEYQIPRGCPLAGVHTTPLGVEESGGSVDWERGGRSHRHPCDPNSVRHGHKVQPQYFGPSFGHCSENAQSSSSCLFLSVERSQLILPSSLFHFRSGPAPSHVHVFFSPVEQLSQPSPLSLGNCRSVPGVRQQEPWHAEESRSVPTSLLAGEEQQRWI